MTEEKQATSTVKKSPVGLIVAGVIGVVVVLIGALVYQFILLPGQITASLNKNIDANNAVNSKAEKQLLEITTQASLLSSQASLATTNLDAVLASTKDLTTKSKGLDSVISEVDKQKANLDAGANSDTKEFRDLVKDNIEGTATIIKDFQNFATYQACLIDNYSTTANKISSLGTELVKVTSTNFEPVKKGVVFAKESATSIENIKGCFTDGNTKYYTPELKTQLNEASAFMISTNEVLSKLSAAADSGNDTELVAQSNNLTALYTNLPALLNDSSELNKAVDVPLKDFQDRVKEINAKDEKAKAKLEDVKKKYNLS